MTRSQSLIIAPLALAPPPSLPSHSSDSNSVTLPIYERPQPKLAPLPLPLPNRLTPSESLRGRVVTLRNKDYIPMSDLLQRTWTPPSLTITEIETPPPKSSDPEPEKANEYEYSTADSAQSIATPHISKRQKRNFFCKAFWCNFLVWMLVAILANHAVLFLLWANGHLLVGRNQRLCSTQIIRLPPQFQRLTRLQQMR